MAEFDPAAEVAKLKADTATRRKPRFTRSRLDRYTGELLELHRAGASVAELQRWLRARRVKVAHSTVARWLAKWLAKHG